MSDEANSPKANSPFRGASTSAARVTRKQWVLSLVLLFCTVVSLLAWWASETGLNQTGFYFIALPGGLAAAVALVPVEPGESAVGPYRVTLIILLASALIVREGFICILMAAPLVMLIVAIVVAAAKRLGQTKAVLVVPLALLLAGSEGVVYELPRDNEIHETRVIDATPNEVLEALAGSRLDLPEIEPLLLRLPFPRPVAATTEGLDPGDKQRVEFTMGVLDLEVAERGTDFVRWRVISDSTPIAGWYAIERIELRWAGVGDAAGDGTQVEVAIAYERQLDPAVYFDPLGRFGIGELGEVLLDTVEANLPVADSIADSGFASTNPTAPALSGADR